MGNVQSVLFGGAKLKSIVISARTAPEAWSAEKGARRAGVDPVMAFAAVPGSATATPVKALNFDDLGGEEEDGGDDDEKDEKEEEKEKEKEEEEEVVPFSGSLRPGAGACTAAVSAAAAVKEEEDMVWTLPEPLSPSESDDDIEEQPAGAAMSPMAFAALKAEALGCNGSARDFRGSVVAPLARKAALPPLSLPGMRSVAAVDAAQQPQRSRNQEEEEEEEKEGQQAGPALGSKARLPVLQPPPVAAAAGAPTGFNLFGLGSPTPVQQRSTAFAADRPGFVSPGSPLFHHMASELGEGPPDDESFDADDGGGEGFCGVQASLHAMARAGGIDIGNATEACEDDDEGIAWSPAGEAGPAVDDEWGDATEDGGGGRSNTTPSRLAAVLQVRSSGELLLSGLRRSAGVVAAVATSASSTAAAATASAPPLAVVPPVRIAAPPSPPVLCSDEVTAFDTDALVFDAVLPLTPVGRADGDGEESRAATSSSDAAAAGVGAGALAHALAAPPSPALPPLGVAPAVSWSSLSATAAEQQRRRKQQQQRRKAKLGEAELEVRWEGRNLTQRSTQVSPMVSSCCANVCLVVVDFG